MYRYAGRLRLLNKSKNMFISSKSSATRPRSQIRAIVGDLAQLMKQQMYFWGCDARYAGGNLLIQMGGKRLAKVRQSGEGSSRYRFLWQGGTIELHSFCAGWYSSDSTVPGVTFIRGLERFFASNGESPLTPGRYEQDRLNSATPDKILSICSPLMEWLADFEQKIEEAMSPRYRESCFEQYRQYGEHRPWLPPAAASKWLTQWLDCPEAAPRAKAYFNM